MLSDRQQFNQIGAKSSIQLLALILFIINPIYMNKIFKIKRLASDAPNCPVDERQYQNEANEEEVGSYAQFAVYAQSEGYNAIAVTDKISGESYEVKL